MNDRMPAGPANEVEFGHEDLFAADPEESIYSHKTETILDEEAVSFGHLENRPG